MSTEIGVEVDRREHPHVRDKLGLYSAGMLDGVEWLTVRTHLAECESCQEEMVVRPIGRALPRRIPADPKVPSRRPPGWPVVVGSSFVAALVAFSVGYALQHSGI